MMSYTDSIYNKTNARHRGPSLNECRTHGSSSSTAASHMLLTTHTTQLPTLLPSVTRVTSLLLVLSGMFCSDVEVYQQIFPHKMHDCVSLLVIRLWNRCHTK